jgi:hypothetical protein
MGNEQWAMGNEQWAMGNSQWAMGNRQLNHTFFIQNLKFKI